MFSIGLPDLLFMLTAPCGYEITVVGKHRPVETLTVLIVRAYLKTQAALKALGYRIHPVMVCRRFVIIFFDKSIS